MMEDCIKRIELQINILKELQIDLNNNSEKIDNMDLIGGYLEESIKNVLNNEMNSKISELSLCVDNLKKSFNINE